MRILIDMDDVIADAEERFNEWYERDFGVRYTKQDLKGTKLYLVVPEEHRKIVKAYPHNKDFFKDLPIIENSREMVQELNNRFDVYIASAAMEPVRILPLVLRTLWDATARVAHKVATWFGRRKSGNRRLVQNTSSER